MGKPGAGVTWTLEELRRKAPLSYEDFMRTRGAAPEQQLKKTWSAAKPTSALWIDGSLVTFSSKLEARVATKLVEEALATKARLYRQVRLPLLSIDPDSAKAGTPYYLTVDFVLVRPSGEVRWIDAKSRRKSREWARGKAAADAFLRAVGVHIEERSA